VYSILDMMERLFLYLVSICIGC